MANDTEVDFSLLDRNLEDIEDLPSFEVPPKGSYVLLVSGTTKMVNDKPAVSLDYEVVSTLELQNKAEKAVPDGSKFNVIYFIENEFGLGSLKKDLAPYAAQFGTSNVGTLVREKIQNVSITGTVDHQVDKKDKSKVYARVKNVAIN